MTKRLSICLLFGVLIVAALLGGRYYSIRTFKVRSRSSDQRVEVWGLPFKGVSKHPLDDCLRVYTFPQGEDLDGGVWQTTIPWGTDLRVSWDATEPHTFSIYQGDSLKMTWRFRGRSAECVIGANLITYNPHELWARTGKPTP
jgi:hypothetical protein